MNHIYFKLFAIYNLNHIIIFIINYKYVNMRMIKLTFDPFPII